MFRKVVVKILIDFYCILNLDVYVCNNNNKVGKIECFYFVLRKSRFFHKI
jgi:hypothetical protein